ncbi:MAG: hypothetical protein ACRCYQ_14040, partial [Nocardioides sp.]
MLTTSNPLARKALATGLLSAVIASGLAAFATPTRAADGGTQAGTSMLGVTARDDLPPQRW